MAASTLSILPESLTAGESLSVSVTIPDKSPAQGWDLKYRFAIAGVSIEVDGSDNNKGGWNVTITPEETLPFPTGRMTFDAIATHENTGIAKAVDRGTIAVTASPVFVSRWADVLESVESAIETLAATDNHSESVSVEGMSTSYTKKDMSQLLKLRAFCIRQRDRERGTKLPSRILSRFG